MFSGRLSLVIIGTPHQLRLPWLKREVSAGGTALLDASAQAIKTWQSRRDDILRGSGCAEGQGLRTPITPSLCTLAVFCALVVLPAQAQTNPPPAPAPQSDASNQSGTLAKYEGETVSGIDFRGTNGIDTATLRSLIVQKAGQPLDRDKLRASIEALYATGRFATLQVEAEVDPAESTR